MRLIDLSYTVEHGMITYKGLPAPAMWDFFSREASRSIYAPGTDFQIGRIDMAANTGTCIDSPFHRYASGKDLAQLDGVVMAASAGRAIAREAFRGLNVRGKAVLIRTGWDRHWGVEAYFEGHPFLTADAARLLAGEGAALVGIDSYNIDDTADWSRPAHGILLGAEIPICEHMRNLANLPGSGFRFSAVPVKVSGFGTFPVRAYAVVED
jgi:kynurenine formamidase